MARNGSGVYTLPAGNPVVTGTTISSTWANNTLNDLGNAMTASLAYDGQTVPVANLPMGGYIHTGVGNATARTNYPSAGQVQDSALTYLTSITGTDTIVATAPVTMSAYAAGQTFRFIAAGTNATTSVTININGIGAKNITKNGATALGIGDIVSGSVVVINYDGTQFQITSTASSGNFTNLSASGTVTFSGTGAVQLTSGTTAQQPVSPTAGMIRYNTTTNSFEGYNGTSWGLIGGTNSTTLGYWQNAQSITANSSIDVGYSASSAGPITIASGITVTVPSGSRWIIL